MMTLIPAPSGASNALSIDHVANFCRRYPGERVTFHTRIRVRQPVSQIVLDVSLPNGLILIDFRGPIQQAAIKPTRPRLTFQQEKHHLIWTVDQPIAAGAIWEYEIQTQVAPTSENRALASCAAVTGQINEARTVSASEWATVTVATRGSYLEYLPALYDQDELLGRFLMLFESFWRPIEAQIETLPFYIDPKMTPPDFLPWLASWLNLVLDERWSPLKRRRLIQAAVSLYRQRGTKRGLKQYLEIYTGRPVRIIEHGANNMQLGKTKFGPGMALGKNNKPHTFTVIVQPAAASTSDGGQTDQPSSEAEVRRMIETILQAEKPAHTAYRLRIEPFEPAK